MDRKKIFYFKQFSIKHERSAMKVGFDSILLGAWADCQHAKRILDIGSGTGLLALMLAQRNSFAIIRAIEPDFNSFEEATENIKNSPWKDRITIDNISLQDFSKTNKNTFDHIICNPPFFNAGINTGTIINSKINVRHAINLTHEELIMYSSKLLVKNGKLSVILPLKEGMDIIEYAKKQELVLSKLCLVITNKNKPIERVLMEFVLSNQNVVTVKSSLNIYSQQGTYSKEYIKLVKDFYHSETIN